jgi:murein DD-endopeptidase MepM/ murein hydrolase activator NlpD
MSTAPYLFGALAAVAAVKTLFRPHRALVREGGVAGCPGATGGRCDPALRVATPEGAPVYSVGSGLVVAVGPHFVHVAARNEPAVLVYEGVLPDVREGQHVGRGQRIGESGGRVAFLVTEFEVDGGAHYVDPASWLAARGQRIAARDTGAGSSWCEQGRHIEVPKAAGAACGLHEPARGNFALLPVSVTVER